MSAVGVASPRHGNRLDWSMRLDGEPQERTSKVLASILHDGNPPDDWDELLKAVQAEQVRLGKRWIRLIAAEEIRSRGGRAVARPIYAVAHMVFHLSFALAFVFIVAFVSFNT